ncbi:MAG TPA: PilZ domain-containing protein [Pyrinomonadaceae bacterium]|nr:PilZ domain-containing protein [Pyrinomonadaceae bacterium]
MQERRTAERIRINFKARWEGLTGQGRGSICDLSSTGCFILTGGEVKPGELIRFEIHFPNQIALVWGQVVYAVAEMGFALRFAFSSDEETRALASLIDDLPNRNSLVLHNE